MPTNDYKTGAEGQTGVWSSLNVDSVRVAPEIDEQIRDMSAPETPFSYLIDKIPNKKTSGQMTFQWMEEWPIQKDGVITTAATGATSGTSIIVDNAELILPGWIFRVLRTGENIKVVSRVVSTNTLTVVRAFGSACRAILAGDPIFILGPADEEGQDAPEMLMRGTDHGELTMQSLTHSVGLTTWEVLTKKRGIGELERLDRQALLVHRNMIEAFLIFGGPGKHTAASGMPIYTMPGLEYFCNAHNVINMGGGMSYDGLADGMGHVFEHAKSNVMYGFMSRRMIASLTRLPEVRRNVQRREESTRIGFEINEIGAGGKTLRCVELPILNRPFIDNQIFVTSLDDLQVWGLSGADGLHIEREIQKNGSKRKQWQIERIIGLAHTNTLGCGVFKNCA